MENHEDECCCGCDCGSDENFELEENILVLTDDDGNEIEFEFLDLIEKDGQEYVVLLPIEPLEDEEEGAVVILKVDTNEDDENESYVSIENEEEAEEIFNIFKDRFKDELDFED